MSPEAKPVPPTAAAAQPSAPASVGDALPPANLPEELLPVYDWWRQQGSNFLVSLAVVVIVFGGTLAFLQYRRTQNQKAAEALPTAETVDALQTLEGEYGHTRMAPLILLKLAKTSYDAGAYDEALAAYDRLLRRHGKHVLADQARVGRAAALEAQQKTDDALEAYTAFEQASPDSYLAPLATMGRARCLAMKGNKDEAADLLERLAVTKAGTPWEQEARDLAKTVATFTGLRASTIFDQLDAASRAQPPTAPAAPAATTNAAP